MKIVNPEYTVEKIVQRMKDAAANAVFATDKSIPHSFVERVAQGNSSRINQDLDIHPITLQPEFQPDGDDHYHINDLLKFNDAQFVKNAYRAILKRPPDAAGFSGLIESLRSGELNKIDVLARLRFSEEGRSKAVEIEGLRIPATLRRLYRLPVIGYVANWFVSIARLPVMVRSHRQSEAHILAQQELMVSQINHLGNSLVAHSRQVAHAFDSGVEANEQLRQRLEHLIGEQAEISNLFLARFTELSEYFEGRLNDEAAERSAELWTLGKQLGEATSQWKAELAALQNDYEQAITEGRERLSALQSSFEISMEDSGKRIRALKESSQRNAADLIVQGQRLLRLLDTAMDQSTSTRDAERLQRIRQEHQDHALESFYAAFDDQFRGPRDEIKERLKVYLPFLADEMVPLVDVGCGRGEWLELVATSGRSATGVESNSVLVEQCRRLGLGVVNADLVEYLRGLPDESVGGITGFHIVEHLALEVLIDFLNESMRVLKSGGVLILETPNPRNVLVGTCNFYFDPTHRNPIPSEVLEFLVESRGFSEIQVLPLNPSDETPVAGDSELADRFNQYFYGPMDYGIVARKSG